MKKLTRDRVVPIISASVSWLIFAMIGSGRPSLNSPEVEGSVPAVSPGCYINLDLVKMVTPTNAGCIVHFDKGHTMGITTSAREVATVADALRREARAVVTAE
jgi:hypothetical protein